MKKDNPFPSVLIELPDDVITKGEGTVVSYWRTDDMCLLQISSRLRSKGQQVSAAERLSDRQKEGNWQLFQLPREIKGCDTAAASTTDDKGNTWVYIYLVWEWLAVLVTVTREGGIEPCNWVWVAISTIRPVLM